MSSLKQGARTDTLEVSEIFGPTIQGEGPSLGRPAIFLRLHRCNLQCSWCDTKFTWDRESPGFNDYKVLSLEQTKQEILSKIRPGQVLPILVITGGEPLIWYRNLFYLVRLLVPLFNIEIETNGTIFPVWELNGTEKLTFNVSPKLVSMGGKYITGPWETALCNFSRLQRDNQVRFKFVCKDLRNLAEVEELSLRFRLFQKNIYIMPEGITSEAINSHIQTLANETIKLGYNLTTRLHTLLWGSEKGR